jgi:hypothetical protein
MTIPIPLVINITVVTFYARQPKFVCQLLFLLPSSFCKADRMLPTLCGSHQQQPLTQTFSLWQQEQQTNELPTLKPTT